MMRILWTVLAMLYAFTAAAQEARDCKEFGGGAITDPHDIQGRSYANGEVTIGVVHDGRRGSNDSLFILVFAPDSKNPDQKTCRIIGKGDRLGFADVRMNFAKAEYTAADGLTVRIPARIFAAQTGETDTTMLAVNVSRQSGEVSVTQELGSE